MTAAAPDPWAWWRNALTGQRGDLTRGQPQPGFYRVKQRALAIWLDPHGDLQWSVTSGYRPRTVDELDDLFGFACTAPISDDLFFRIAEGGAWPDDVSADIEAARAIPSADGSVTRQDNAPPAEQVILDELQAIRAAHADWFASVGRQVTTEEHDARTVAFTDRVAALKKQAAASHKADKQPWLDGGREVDRRWDAAKAETDKAQREIAATALAYRQARDQRQQEEARVARVEAAEARRAAVAAGQPAPVFQAPRKAATGLRTVKQVVIDDLPVAAAFLAGLDPVDPDFIRAVQKMARVRLERDEAVPGARLVSERVAA